MKKIILLSLFISIPLYPMPELWEKTKNKVVHTIKKTTKKMIEFVKAAANHEGVRAAGIMAVTFAATFYGLKKFNFYNSTVIFPKVVGIKEFLLPGPKSANNNILTSVPVQEVFVTPQQGPTCGYHQVKNLLTILEWKITGEWNEKNTEELFGKQGAWRSLLVKRSGVRYKNISTYLSGDDINFLLSQEMSSLVIPTDISIGYDILDNIDHLGTGADIITPSITQHLCYESNGKDSYHGIIVGTSYEENAEFSEKEMSDDRDQCLAVLANLILGTATEQDVSNIKRNAIKYNLKVDQNLLCQIQTKINYIYEKLKITPESTADKQITLNIFQRAIDQNPTNQDITDLIGIFTEYEIRLNAEELLKYIYNFSSDIKRKVGFGILPRHGHWFGILIHQNPDGQRDYCVFDSLNKNPNITYRLHDFRVKKVIDHIEQSLNI